jgi:NB-ARC domain-containing protein
VTDRPPPDETTPTVTASGDRGVGVGRDITNSNIFTGNIKIESPGDPVTTALHQLRAPVGDFVGREQEIDTLINALRRDNRAGITGISGMGGIGKTELALLVADRLRDDYPDAQFFINLQGTDANPRSPQDAMAICIRAFLGPEVKLPEDLEPLVNLYRSELSGKRVLLLLDNAADSAQVRPAATTNRLRCSSHFTAVRRSTGHDTADASSPY